MTSSTVGFYGWRPDKPDLRDVSARRALASRLADVPTPPSADLRPGMPPVYDQGQLGSCTGNAIAGAISYALLKAKLGLFVPSRLFIYYNERVIEGTVREDAGAEIRDGIKSVAKQGVCSETDWPYNVNKFMSKPTARCYRDATRDVVKTYASVSQSLADLRACLASGFPVVFGFSVYDSFESDAVAHTGVVNMPSASEQQVGGHAVVLVGYDDATQRFTVRNSWGDQWGMRGYFTIPYDYVTSEDLASDFWQIDVVG